MEWPCYDWRMLSLHTGCDSYLLPRPVDSTGFFQARRELYADCVLLSMECALCEVVSCFLVVKALVKFVRDNLADPSISFYLCKHQF